MPIILEWLQAYQPDVLALQETKVTDDLFPVMEFEASGWKAVFKGEKSYNGVAMITPHEPDETSFGLQDGDDGESDSRLVHIRYEGVHVLNTYIPQGAAFDSPKFPFKLKWFKRLKRYIEERIDLQNDQFLWVGDLNVAPTPIDVHNHEKIWPHVVHCQEVTDALTEITDLGLVDILRQHLPGDDVFTYWDYRSKTSVSANRGWRIDHIWGSEPIADRSEEVLVDRAARSLPKPSDHTFVLGRFS